MADSKVTALTELTAVAPADVLYIIDDAAGTPASRKVTVENVQADWHVGCRVYNSGNIAVSNSTSTYPTFNSERYDTDTMHDTGSNTERITITTAGVYAVGCCMEFESNSSGRRFVSIQLSTDSGSNWNDIAGDERAVSSTTDMIPVSTIWKFSAGDLLRVRVFQTSGISLNLLATANRSPEFWAQRIG